MIFDKREQLYTGKAKSLYKTENDELLIAQFRDDTTAFDGEKHEKLANKGIVNNHISAYLMQRLEEEGVPTHFEAMLSSNESVVKCLKMIPLENVVRNVAAGSLCRRLGVTPGMELQPPLHEFFLKNDALHDPMVTVDHAISFGWASAEQLKEMKRLSLETNRVLKALFAEHGLLLVDAKYEFGIDVDGVMVLGDEISPDSCRIWDSVTHEKLDKDRFRQNLGSVVASYEQIASRLGIELQL